MFILIADDEKMIRYSLQSMLSELYPDEHMYIFATNGRDAVAQIKKLPPDIAFLDIRMPLLNGLDVIKECSEFAPHTKWVVLTGYAEFEYAQKAIRLAAFSYLLKPVDTKTLKEVIDKLKLIRQIEVQNKNMVFSFDIIRSFQISDLLGTDEISLLPYKESNYIIFQIFFDTPEKKSLYSIKQELFHRFEMYCNESPSVLLSAVFFNNNGELCIICSVNESWPLIHQVNFQIQNYPNDMVSVFYGTGNTVKSIYDLSREILSISDIRIIRSCRKATNIDTILSIEELPQLLMFCHEIDTFIYQALAANRESMRIQAAALSVKDTFASIFQSIDHSKLYLYLEHILEIKLYPKTYKGFIEEMYHKTSMLLDNKRNPNFDITAVKDFVYKNYETDVSISHISEYFDISSSHFSKVFHDKTGQKYIDFVTEVRIERAKRLLREYPDISVKETAESVGYVSVRHFSKVFQKYTGVLPSNYV